MKPEYKQRHNELMAENADYRRAYETTTVPVGRRFTVALECVDQFDSGEIMDAMYCKGKLLAGCKVYRLDFQDEGERLRDLKAELARYIQS